MQAIGGTIFEENAYDNEGQPLATTFMDYLIPSACESPNIIVSLQETRSPATLLGAKGAGEGAGGRSLRGGNQRGRGFT